jgi:sugar (pentulose or hexulose) kinase
LGVLDILSVVARTQAGLVARVASPAKVRRVVATGGGARSDLWLQMKAEVLGATVVRPAVEEPACLGAAVFAAAAAGVHPTIESAAGAMVRAAKEFSSD